MFVEVGARLEEAGHPNIVVDLHDASDVASIVQAVVDAVPEDVSPTVLIGFSAAGRLLPAIADRLGTTESIVYVDAGLPRPGLSFVDSAPAELVELVRSTVDSQGLAAPWPLWWPPQELAEILPDPAQRDAFIAQCPRLPWSYFAEPAPPVEWRGPVSYLQLSAAYQEQADQVRAEGQPVLVRDLHHLAPLTHPDEVSEALLELLDRSWTGLRFGAGAQLYHEVRPVYADELVDRALAYAGHPTSAVEVGAGTGKATETFAARGVELTCVEPDPGMATFLSGLFVDRPHVTVVQQFFEKWTPPSGGVPLLYFALAWHWADPRRRAELAHAALCPGGTLALFDNQNTFADEALMHRIHAVYDEVAPQLSHIPQPVDGGVIAERSAELAESGLFTDIDCATVVHDQPYPTSRYIGLLNTFSNHLSVAPARRRLLHQRIADVIDADGGVVVVRLVTTVVLARAV
jgi:hypothetical protein